MERGEEKDRMSHSGEKNDDSRQGGVLLVHEEILKLKIVIKGKRIQLFFYWKEPHLGELKVLWNRR